MIFVQVAGPLLMLLQEICSDQIHYAGIIKREMRMDIAFNVTRRCNKGCDYCYLDLTGEDLPYSDIRRIMNEVEVDTVTLTGGEPLKHPRFANILLLISGLGHHIHLLTNGILLKGKNLEMIVAAKPELFVTYNCPDQKIRQQLADAHKCGLDVNVNHVLTHQTLSMLGKACEDISFAKSILLLYPTNMEKNNVRMYGPEEWLPLLGRAIDIVSQFDIKTYFEQAFTERNSELARSPPCPTGKDIFIDVDGSSYPCCLLVDSIGGYKGARPIKYNVKRCDFLRRNQMPPESRYVRICPISVTDLYDKHFIFPSHIGEK
ncbi:MAG: hypothetical protein COS47_01340 [Candidatus Nealsonbacteria bacterium CG03_land_8_20_14_0_80_36_12]|uniref:Radical SAM core domain-containing protein n=1 Tax=Candidatus Nealsonbacteria bacterium CG03_land_8_20_14_0_80_36_12 TaxID=1974701 RepID=A0A2M7BYB3_9BACT|nr:MAG: hypothetical protein COS47_01340 [Candidatus Nealsonbacteria bacterium CG03_land_8_20_14_0_80_36_12]